MNDQYVGGWDGVRALAVAAVVFFHLEPTVLPGGFLGVTTFFVLAGALATTRIHREIEKTGTFRLRAYGGGRVRRLLPALLVYVGVVMVWVWFRRPVLFDDIAGDAIAALLYVTPWRELSGPGGYAAAFSIGPEPLLHTWSLGVEEAAWILTGVSIALTRRVWSAAAATAVVGVGGYILWFGEADLYYSPARLTEFAVGAGLGLFLLARPRQVSWIIGAVGGLVLAAMMVNTAVVDTYEGQLLIAAAASAGVIASATTGAFAAVLSTPVMRWIGTRSYSIYLWHVGLIELTDLPGYAVVIATGVLAEASFRLVESPARIRRAPMRLAPGLLLTTAICAGLLVALPSPDDDVELDVLGPPLETTDAPPLNTPSSDSSPVNSSPINSAAGCARCLPSPIAGAPDFDPFVVDELDNAVTVAIIGDSTGVSLATALSDWADRTGELIVHDLTIGGCSPLSFAGSGWYRTRISTDDDGPREREGCMPTVADVPDDTDLIVVIATGTPILDHLSTTGEWVDLTDPAMQSVFDQFLTDTDADARARGIPLIATTTASMPESTIALMRDPARTDAFNRVMAANGIHTYDLTTPLESNEYHRFDGTHLHVDTVIAYDGEGRNEGHRYVSEVMGPALVGYARSLTR